MCLSGCHDSPLPWQMAEEASNKEQQHSRGSMHKPSHVRLKKATLLHFNLSLHSSSRIEKSFERLSGHCCAQNTQAPSLEVCIPRSPSILHRHPSGVGRPPLPTPPYFMITSISTSLFPPGYRPMLITDGTRLHASMFQPGSAMQHVARRRPRRTGLQQASHDLRLRHANAARPGSSQNPQQVGCCGKMRDRSLSLDARDVRSQKGQRASAAEMRKMRLLEVPREVPPSA